MFYLVIVQNDSIPAIYSYQSENEALAAFHSELAYRAEGRTSTKCSILDSNLVSLRNESYTAPVQVTEPTEGEQ